MGNLASELIFPGSAGEKGDGSVDMAGFKAPGTDHAELFASHRVRVEGDVAGVGILAEDEKLCAIAAKVDAFVHCVGMAYAFDDLVSAIGSSLGEDGFAAFGDIGEIGDIDGRGGAELAGEFEAMLGTADDDDFRRARFEADGKRGEPDRSGSLDDDDIAPGDWCAFNSVDRSGESAAGADESFGGQFVRETKDGTPGTQEDHFGIASAEMRRFAGAVRDAVRFARNTAGGLALEAAIEALAAIDGTGPGDAVAGLQRVAAPILLKAFAETHDSAGGFMAHDDRSGDGELAEPQVHVGSTDSGDIDSDESFTR